MLSGAQPPGVVVEVRHHDKGAEIQNNGETKTTSGADVETKTAGTIPSAIKTTGTANPSGQTPVPKQPAMNHTTLAGTKVEEQNGGTIAEIRNGIHDGILGMSQIQNQMYPTGATGGSRTKLGILNVHENEFQNHQSRQLHKKHRNIRGLSTPLGIGTVQRGREIRTVTL